MQYDNLHPLQMVMLNKIMTLPEARFRDLKIVGLSTDHQSYHIKALIKANLLAKATSGKYILTLQGKEYAGRMDEHTGKIETQGKRGVLVRLSKKEGNDTLYLVNKRLKQPFYGYVGFNTGKVKEGEAIYAAAARELREETGFSAELHLVAIKHFLDYKENGDFLRDIYFYVFNAFEPQGELLVAPEGEGLENFWITLDELKKEKTFPGFWEDPEFFGKKTKRTRKDQAVRFLEKVRVIQDY